MTFHVGTLLQGSDTSFSLTSVCKDGNETNKQTFCFGLESQMCTMSQIKCILTLSEEEKSWGKSNSNLPIANTIEKTEQGSLMRRMVGEHSSHKWKQIQGKKYFISRKTSIGTGCPLRQLSFQFWQVLRSNLIQSSEEHHLNLVLILFWAKDWHGDFLRSPLTRMNLWLYSHIPDITFKNISSIIWDHNQLQQHFQVLVSTEDNLWLSDDK